MNDLNHTSPLQPRQDPQSSEWEDDYCAPSYCRHPEHQPPGMLVIPHGKVWRHVCPGCGYTVKIRSSEASLGDGPDASGKHCAIAKEGQ